MDPAKFQRSASILKVAILKVAGTEFWRRPEGGWHRVPEASRRWPEGGWHRVWRPRGDLKVAGTEFQRHPEGGWHRVWRPPSSGGDLKVAGTDLKVAGTESGGGLKMAGTKSGGSLKVAGTEFQRQP